MLSGAPRHRSYIDNCFDAIDPSTQTDVCEGPLNTFILRITGAIMGAMGLLALIQRSWVALFAAIGLGVITALYSYGMRNQFRDLIERLADQGSKGAISFCAGFAFVLFVMLLI